MTDFQEAFSLIDDAKIHIEELNQNKTTWIDKSREAVHNGNVMNFYFCIIKKTNDNFFNKDWVGAIIMCNTIMSEEGQCWIYISIKDADENEIHIEKHIPIENSLEYYNLAKEFVRDVEFVNVEWIQNLNKWLKGDIISSKDE